MALSGIQIYKLRPRTNCKDCGFPTCLAFAMKLAAKQVELAGCPHVSEESKSELAASAAPPIRLISLKANGSSIEAGNETVLFRHEKTFYHRPGLFVRLRDDLPLDDLKSRAEQAESFNVNYVGIDLSLDGFAVEAASNSGSAFSNAVSAVRAISKRPLILIGRDPDVIAAGLQAIDGETPLICSADESNWEAMAALAKQQQAALAVSAGSLDALAELAGKVAETGLKDLVLAPEAGDLSQVLTLNTPLRTVALPKSFRPLGYPIVAFPAEGGSLEKESIAAVQAITRYAGFIVMDCADPELLYPLLVLRQNIYTDPQKPIQVTPGIYEINNPGPDSPALVTTNFSITYFSVANEVESAGMPAWLLVCDAEGMSVLTAWAAGKFDSERIARDVKTFGLADKINHKSLVLPGHVAVLSG